MSTNLPNKIIDRLIEEDPYKYENMDRELLTNIIFRRYPHVRLTRKGFDILRRIYDTYVFDTEEIIPKNKIKLYRNSTYPYYIGRTQFVLFAGEDAMSAKLIGDINSWIEYNL